MQKTKHYKTLCPIHIIDHKRFQPTARKLGFASASFEVNDRPVFEDFMGGLGFAYAVGLAARLCFAVTRRRLASETSFVRQRRTQCTLDHAQSKSFRLSLASYGLRLFVQHGSGSIGRGLRVASDWSESEILIDEHSSPFESLTLSNSKSLKSTLRASSKKSRDRSGGP